MAVMVLLTMPLPMAYGATDSSDVEKPIEIEADSADIDERRGITIYQGNVIVRQGGTRLNAAKVTIHQEQRKAKRIVAEGQPARFRQKTGTEAREVNGEALRIEYDVGSEILILQGKAKLAQGKDRFSSDRIVYDRNKKVVKAGGAAKGKKRVHITIDPTRQ